MVRTLTTEGELIMVKEFITKSGLKERGWTEKAINMWLTVDHESANPFYKSASPMKLYKISDVIKVEGTEEFQAWFEKKKSRATSYEKAIQTKKQKSMALMQTCIDRLKPPKRYPLRKIKKQAVHERVAYLRMIGRSEEAISIGVYEPNKRQMCNYIRHNLVQGYDEDCWTCYGLVGVNECYLAYKSAVMDVIFSVYPELKYDWRGVDSENGNDSEDDNDSGGYWEDNPA